MAMTGAHLKSKLKSVVLRSVPPVRRLYDQVQAYKSQVLALQSSGASSGDRARQFLTGSFRPNSWFAPEPATSDRSEFDDLRIAKRIVEAYRRSTATPVPLGRSMWSNILSEHHLSLNQCLAAGDLEGTAQILRNPGASNIFFGIDSLLALHLEELHSAQARFEDALVIVGGLARLAEALGVLPVFNPEALYPQLPPPWTADDLVSRVEEALGTELAFPNPYPNEHGIRTKRGIAAYRTSQSIYQAWRLRQLVQGIQEPRVLEIGAGLGRTPFYAWLIGIRHYTIVDLPTMNAIQAYFLASVLGEDNVLLYGEAATRTGPYIRILPAGEFLNGSASYDAIMNVDSLTEMDPAMARAYWTRIAAGTKRFLSINHEGNPFTVAELIKSSSKIASVDRFPYWMRLGYVEERVLFA